MTAVCHFKHEWQWSGDCSGPLQRCHLIPKQQIKRDRPDVDVWDERLWVPGCEKHHVKADLGVRLPLVAPENMPPAFIQWTEEHGYFWTVRGWRAEKLEVAA